MKGVIQEFKNNGIRTSVFVDPNLKYIEGVKELGGDRIELYTESYANNFAKGNRKETIRGWIKEATGAKVDSGGIKKKVRKWKN